MRSVFAGNLVKNVIAAYHPKDEYRIKKPYILCLCFVELVARRYFK